jgi:hypothetical protein
VAPDRVSHSALGAADNITETGNMLLYGFTNKKAESLIPLARSWNHPPKVKKLSGVSSLEYQKEERAYKLLATADQLSFELEASDKSPVHNPCFIIDGWDQEAAVLINGEQVNHEDAIRQGLVRGTDGELDLVLWIKTQSNKNMSFALTKKKGGD